jgi:hypothetical protein
VTLKKECSREMEKRTMDLSASSNILKAPNECREQTFFNKIISLIEQPFYEGKSILLSFSTKNRIFLSITGDRLWSIPFREVLNFLGSSTPLCVKQT